MTCVIVQCNKPYSDTISKRRKGSFRVSRFSHV